MGMEVGIGYPLSPAHHYSVYYIFFAIMDPIVEILKH